MKQGDAGVSVAYVYPFWGPLLSRPADYSMDIIGMGLAESIAGHGHHTMVYLRGEAGDNREEEVRGVTYRLVPRRFAGRRIRSSALRRVFAFLSFSLYGVGAGVYLRKKRPDIVHIYIFDELIPLVRAIVPSSTRIVLHMHDHRQTLGDSARVERRLQKADLLVGCSEFVTEAVKAAFPSLADRCATVINATDIDVFSPRVGERPDGPTRLLFVGRLSPEKGIHTLLEAFHQVRQVHPDVELDVVGPSNLASLKTVTTSTSRPRIDPIRDLWTGKRYQELLEELVPDGTESVVRLHGPMAHDQLPELFRRADIVVFPSIWDEPFGLPVIEAMASGRPVVASAVGGIVESIEDGRTGYLFPPSDVDALADRISLLVDDPALLGRLGSAARTAAEERFNWPRYVNDWLALYRTLTSSSDGSAASDG